MINEVRRSFESEESQNLKLSEFTLGEQKDLILNLCLKYPKQEANIKNVRNILFPNSEKEQIKYLMILISEHFPEVLGYGVELMPIGLYFFLALSLKWKQSYWIAIPIVLVFVAGQPLGRLFGIASAVASTAIRALVASLFFLLLLLPQWT